jgi:hypothetical protein
LGFKYLEDYFWRPKRIIQNGSPNLINSIPDLVLQEDFGSHTIELSEVFSDPEGDELLLFASSVDPLLISTVINGRQLILSGGEAGNTTIKVTAIDANGGSVMDGFDVKVTGTASSEDLEELSQSVTIFPNPTRDYVSVIGEFSDQHVTIFSADGSFQQELYLSGNETRINMKHLAPGIYFIHLTVPDKGYTKVKKVIKY